MRKVKLEDALEGSDWEVNNSLDTKHTPYPPEEIVRRARAMVDKKLSYDVITYNCEHFANEMRYGEKESAQALQVRTSCAILAK